MIQKIQIYKFRFDEAHIVSFTKSKTKGKNNETK